MSLTIEQVKADIEALSSEDFRRLQEWIEEKSWQQWDDQVENDVALGKLDFLREEAMTAKRKGQLKNL